MSPRITISPIGKEGFATQEVEIEQEAATEAYIALGVRLLAAYIGGEPLTPDIQAQLLKLQQAVEKSLKKD